MRGVGPRGLDTRMDCVILAICEFGDLKDLNLLIEPPKSLPIPRGLAWKPSKAPSPPLEPPQLKDRLKGLEVRPIILLVINISHTKPQQRKLTYSQFLPTYN